jgi:hypothetical protein
MMTREVRVASLKSPPCGLQNHSFFCTVDLISTFCCHCGHINQIEKDVNQPIAAQTITWLAVQDFLSVLTVDAVAAVPFIKPD